MDQLFQQHERRDQRLEQPRQERHEQRPQQMPRPQQPGQPKRPMKVLMPHHRVTIDFQPVIDWVWRLACLATWGGLAALIAWLAFFHAAG
jgi:hypothetical protein